MIAVTSPGFVLFAALLAGLWYVCPPPRRWQLMLGANLVFYAVLCWQALPVLLACTFLVWWCGRRTAAKGTFYAGLAAALFPLLLLKYLPAAFGWQGKLANALGIGYFTLQLISYLCDVRRGKLLPEERYARLLCYASFFLSITQGPFNRYDELMPQMDRPARWDTARAWRGVQRSAWGYFKKLAVADRAAVVVDAVFANPAAYDRTQLLLGSVLFTVQLYADFSGYTDIVLGVGEVLGLTKRQIFFKITLLQMVKRIIPPMSNEIITLVKDTSLARIIAIVELTKAGEDYVKSAGITWPLFYTGVYYLLFVGLLTLLFRYLERRLSYFR